MCNICEIPLHIIDCFNVYHRVNNIQLFEDSVQSQFYHLLDHQRSETEDLGYYID